MTMLPFNPSRVIKAAIRSHGMIWTGWRHADILRQMRNQGISRERCQSAEQGFQTTTRAFCSREDALETAVGSGQISNRSKPHVLLSEYLWDANGNPLEANP